MDIGDTIRRLKEELPSGVRLAAVSKFHPADAIREAYGAGQRILRRAVPRNCMPRSRNSDRRGIPMALRHIPI